MYTLVQVVGWWVLVSCVVGPLLTWSFFRFERDERDRDVEVRGEEGVVYISRWTTSMSLQRSSTGLQRSS